MGADGFLLDGDSGARVRALADAGPPRMGWDGVGEVREDREAIARHIQLVLGLPQINLAAIRERGFHVALDCVRGAGGTTMPALLEELGCRVSAINLETDGKFPRPPEPLPENLGDLARLVRETRADIGFAVDPDVDRLAVVDENANPIGEDYTLAFAVRAVLGDLVTNGRNDTCNVVANLSTSLVVENAATESGGRFLRAPVGEANVARVILESNAVIGGEGNGGVILPSLHVGRDAPVGVALILHLLARTASTVSALVKWRVIASGALLGIFFIPTVFGAFINEVFRTRWGNIISLGALIKNVTAGLFGTFERVGGVVRIRDINDLVIQEVPLLEPPLWASWTVLFLICAICLALLSWKVKAYEVVR